MSNEADLEYGPTPEGAEYEHTDVNPTIGYQFAIFLAVAMLISAGIVYGTYWFFESQEVASDEASQIFPLGAGRSQVPPAPRLQTQPFKDVYLLKQHEQEVLTTYGWVDEANGVVRIPITEAMRLIEERGLPVRPAPAEGVGYVVQGSSAGRTSAPR